MEHCLIEYRIQLNSILYPYQIQYLKKQFPFAYIDPFRNMIVMISIPYYSGRLENIPYYKYPSHLKKTDIEFFQKEKIKNLLYPFNENTVKMFESEICDINAICENRIFKYILANKGSWYQTYIFEDIPQKIQQINTLQSYLDPLYALLLCQTLLKFFM